MINLLLATLKKTNMHAEQKIKSQDNKISISLIRSCASYTNSKLTLLLTGYVGNRPTGSTCPKRPDVGILIDVDGLRSWTSGRLVGAFSA